MSATSSGNVVIHRQVSLDNRQPHRHVWAIAQPTTSYIVARQPEMTIVAQFGKSLTVNKVLAGKPGKPVCLALTCKPHSNWTPKCNKNLLENNFPNSQARRASKRTTRVVRVAGRRVEDLPKWMLPKNKWPTERRRRRSLAGRVVRW